MSNDIDELLMNRVNNINKLMNKYSNELVGYKYIEHLDEFTTLKLKGNIRYINKYDEVLKMGGHLIKIINNNGWYALLLQPNKKYYVSFSSNYIFYQVSKEEQFRKWAECFITDIDKGLYDAN